MSEKKVPQAPTARNVYQRLSAVMRQVRGVSKGSENTQGRFRYAGHEAVTEALRGAYVEHGLVRSANVTKCEVIGAGTVLLTVEVSWINVDDPGDRHTVTIPGLQGSTLKSGLPTHMQIGMALSYSVKNAEFKIFSLTGDDSLDSEDDRAEPHDRPDEYADWNGNAARPASRDEASDLALGYLSRFNECQSKADVEKLKAEIRGNWSAVRGVPDFGEAVVVQSKKALARVSQPRMRQPGEDD